MTFIHKTQNALISVLLPVKNGMPHLAEAVDSIFRQTYHNFEIIAIDHSSRDGSSAILNQYAKSDPRMKVHRFDGDNFVDCLNFGLSLCGGGYIARMDADDISRPDRFIRQLSFLRDNPDVGIVGSAVRLFGGGGIKEGYRRYEKWINSIMTPEDFIREMFVESPMPHPSVMMRREILDIDVLGGYRDSGWPEDYDLWMRAFFAGIRMAKVPETLLQWRDRPDRFSRTSKRYSRKNFHKLRAFYLAKLLKDKKIVIQGAGTTGRIIGRLLKGFGANLIAYIDINPRRIGGTKLGLPVYPAERMAAFAGSFLIAAVSSWGARELIRQEAKNAGFTEGVDFLCAS
ncbi:MAG: glycosyl transferase [bacterium]|nr:MAG: glycosyl transferase [bacterium]